MSKYCITFEGEGAKIIDGTLEDAREYGEDNAAEGYGEVDKTFFVDVVIEKVIVDQLPQAKA